MSPTPQPPHSSSAPAASPSLADLEHLGDDALFALSRSAAQDEKQGAQRLGRWARRDQESL